MEGSGYDDLILNQQGSSVQYAKPTKTPPLIWQLKAPDWADITPLIPTASNPGASIAQYRRRVSIHSSFSDRRA